MQKFIDSTLADAIKAGCDTCQVKYDGVFTQFTVANGRIYVHNNILGDGHLSFPCDDVTINCTLIGTYHPHQDKAFVFDCWLIQEPDGTLVDLREQPYRSRFVATKIQTQMIGERLTLVQNLPIGQAKDLWNIIPSNPKIPIKGLVFRNSKDLANVPLRCARWYSEKPGELI